MCPRCILNQNLHFFLGEMDPPRRLVVVVLATSVLDLSRGICRSYGLLGTTYKEILPSSSLFYPPQHYSWASSFFNFRHPPSPCSFSHSDVEFPFGQIVMNIDSHYKVRGWKPWLNLLQIDSLIVHRYSQIVTLQLVCLMNLAHH